jgi:hypothetical protein
MLFTTYCFLFYLMQIWQNAIFSYEKYPDPSEYEICSHKILNSCENRKRSRKSEPPEPPIKDTNWCWQPSGLCGHIFRGLTSEKRHWFRVIAIGSGVQLAYSPIVTMVVQ